MSTPARHAGSEERSRILFISFDGLLEPLGQSQILPYLRGLATRGVAITVLSFEKAADWRKRWQKILMIRSFWLTQMTGSWD